MSCVTVPIWLIAQTWYAVPKTKIAKIGIGKWHMTLSIDMGNSPLSISIEPRTYDTIILTRTEHTDDLAQMLNYLKPFCTERTRIFIRWQALLITSMCRLVGIQRTRFTRTIIAAIATEQAYQVIGTHRHLLGYTTVLRLQKPQDTQPLSVSIIIPCKNEAGNIHELIKRCPTFAGATELIFVEGGSHDGTRACIQQALPQYSDKNIQLVEQRSRGKAHAVHEGIAASRGQIIMILDGDITVPPETLTHGYHLIQGGYAEFVNYTRLIYPMEQKAMQWLNGIANHLFPLFFSWLLGHPLTDTLCGTKVFRRTDYERMRALPPLAADPFGDFDLLLGAIRLHLAVAEVPISYKARRYGTTQIHRFRQGWILAIWCLRVGIWRLKTPLTE